MERAEHILVQRLLEPDLIGDVITEHFEDVHAIGTFRCRGHAKHEIRCEIVDDPTVACGGNVVGLVDENVVEMLLAERSQCLGIGQRIHHGEHVFAVALLAVA